MIYLTRKCEFSASHYYYNPEWSEEDNRKLFGKCANRNGHGHNYTVEVTVRGEVDAATGFLIDLKELKELMNREVMENLDHRNLNREVAEFAGQNPTTENIALYIWRRLEAGLAQHRGGLTANSPGAPAARLHRVRVYESHDLFVDVYGEA
jgi:6-pyruvoyltetrahydropterin/6-carboxytetrahydropterin synthase